MSKIKICHVVSALEAGGVESVIYNYCNKLDSNKFEVHLLHQRKASEKNIKEFNELGFIIKEIPEKTKHPLKNYFETKKYFKNQKIDIVHAHMTLVNFLPLMAAKNVGIKKRISHSHNNDVRKKNILKKLFENILKKLTMYFATDRIACGNDAGKYLYSDKEFIVLNNALNLDKFSFKVDVRKEIRQRYGIDSSAVVIGNIGRFTEQKNQKFLIDVFYEYQKKNTNSYLFIIGDGYLAKDLKEQVKLYGLDGKVFFTGIIENTCDFYSVFDIFALPSLWEGLPVVGIEAQASGLYCLFSDGIDENGVIIKDRVNLLSLNKSSWIEHIDQIVCNGNSYNRQISKDKFEDKNLSIDKEIQKLVDIYLNNRG